MNTYYIKCTTADEEILLKIKANNEDQAKGKVILKYQIKEIKSISTTKPKQPSYLTSNLYSRNHSLKGRMN